MSRRSLLALAGSMTAGAAIPWSLPRVLLAQSPDLSTLKAADTVVLFVPGFMAQVYEALSTYALQGFDAQLRSQLKQVPVVGESLAGSMPSLRAPLKAGAAVSFHSQERKLDSLGVHYQNIAHISDAGFSTQQGVVANGRAIAGVLTRLRGQNVRRVVIVTHSKGGLDTLEALTTNESLWNAPVVGWVALQAPFFGSPVAGPPADSAIAQNALLAGARQALGRVMPLAQAFDDLTPGSRSAYMDQKASAIARLTAAVPVRSYFTKYSAATPAETLWSGVAVARNVIASVFNPSLLKQIAEAVAQSETRNIGSPANALKEATTEATHLIDRSVITALDDPLGSVGLMDPFNLAMRQPNDGLVPVDSTKLPGAKVLELPTGDHAAPVMIAAPFKEFWTTKVRDDQTLQPAAGVVGSA